MQLEKRPLLRAALATASCALVGLPLCGVAADPAQVESGVLHYSEKDRVDVSAVSAIVTLPLAEEESLAVTPTIDVITGASPNGASPSSTSQSFGTSSAAAGQLPLQQFSDTRLALALAWQYPVDKLNRAVLGANFSVEKDYRSVGLNYTRMRDYNNKLTTLTAGIAGSLDTVIPSTKVIPDGMSPVTFSGSTSTGSGGAGDDNETADRQIHAVTRASGVVSGGGGGDGVAQDIRDKQVVDALVGVTQVLNRRTLMQFNYGLGIANGYMTDPYKIISVVDGVTGETTGYLFENRPDLRIHQSLYWKTLIHLPQDVIRLSYRRYWDDWQIHSDTVELAYHFKLGGSGYYIEPQWRYYKQSGADFYHHSLPDSVGVPRYASADYRLAPMTSHTYGVKFAMPFSEDNELSLRAFYMKQTGENHPADAIGVQRTLDLYPALEALTLQLGWNFKF